MITTPGRLLVNEILPEDLRDYSTQFDKKKLSTIFEELADKYPEKYNDVLNKFLEIGRQESYYGGLSLKLEDLMTPKQLDTVRKNMQNKINAILQENIPMEQKWEKLTNFLMENKPIAEKYIDKVKSSFVDQVRSRARGNPAQWQRLIFGDVLYTDQWGRPISIPILKGFAQGITPAQFFASTFPARKALMTVYLGTGEAGWLSKLMNQAVHDLLVTKVDAPKKGKFRGVPASVNEPHIVGRLLAVPTGGFPADTLITPKVVSELKNRNIKNILVRSVLTAGDPQGGLLAKDVGLLSSNKLPEVGELPGLTAAQAISERLTQQALSTKHTAGMKKSEQSGLQILRQILEMPKESAYYAIHADTHGKVTKIDKTDQGDKIVYIGKQQHVVPPDLDLKVKVGDYVEEGDALTNGIPNIRSIVQHKGIGEARRVFSELMEDFVTGFGVDVNRRNIDLLSRALIRFVKFNEPWNEYNVGDIEEYDIIEHEWSPRKTAREVYPVNALGEYLEEPVLHYSVGTKITPAVIKTLKLYNIDKVLASKEPPPFDPHAIRASDIVGHNPDWLVRLLGSYQKRNLLNALYGGSYSGFEGRSFVPALAAGTPFGTIWPPK